MAMVYMESSFRKICVRGSFVFLFFPCLRLMIVFALFFFLLCVATNEWRTPSLSRETREKNEAAHKQVFTVRELLALLVLSLAKLPPFTAAIRGAIDTPFSTMFLLSRRRRTCTATQRSDLIGDHRPDFEKSNDSWQTCRPRQTALAAWLSGSNSTCGRTCPSALLLVPLTGNAFHAADTPNQAQPRRRSRNQTEQREREKERGSNMRALKARNTSASSAVCGALRSRGWLSLLTVLLLLIASGAKGAVDEEKLGLTQVVLLQPTSRPTSQPSSLFVAPSIDQSLLTEPPSLPAVPDTPPPSIPANSAEGSKGSEAEKFQKEIEDEDSTVLSVTFAMFVAIFAAACVFTVALCYRKYRSSRGVINIDNHSHRYRLVSTSEDVR